MRREAPPLYAGANVLLVSIDTLRADHLGAYGYVEAETPRLDRLARSTLHLCQIADLLKRKRVDLRVLDQNIDTSDATGRLLFNMLGAIAQFETELRSERQMDGILKAKARGVQFGQKPKLSADEVVELQRRRAEGVLIKELMKEYDLSKASVYRYLRQDENQTEASVNGGD